MKSMGRIPMEDEEESEFPGCLIAGVLIAFLGSLFIIITTVSRIKDMVVCSKPVVFMKTAFQKRREENTDI